jgi:hypothetical protein
LLNFLSKISGIIMAPTANGVNGHVNGDPVLNMQGLPAPLPKVLAINGNSNRLEEMGLRDLDVRLALQYVQRQRTLIQHGL